MCFSLEALNTVLARISILRYEKLLPLYFSIPSILLCYKGQPSHASTVGGTTPLAMYGTG